MRRRNRKEKKSLIVSFFFLVFFLAVTSLFFYYWFTKTLFVSPLPSEEFASPFTTRELKTLLEKSNITFSEVKSSTGSSILVTLKDGNDVLFSTKKALGEQVSSLQLILSRLTIEGKRFKNLDLRFEKPSVVYE